MSAIAVDETYEQETARLTLSRVPFAVIGLLISLGGAWVFEHYWHPQRNSLFATLLSLELAAWLLAWSIPRLLPMAPGRKIDAVLIATVAIEWMMCSYHIVSHGEGDVLGMALAYTNVGAMLLFPWGSRRQALLVVGGLFGYAMALATTVSTASPSSIYLIGQTSLGALTILGAYFADDWRHRLFAQTNDLKTANDSLRQVNEVLHLQMAERQRTADEMSALLDIARDVAGALESTEIVRRVQRRIAEILPCDRVATFYRDTESAMFRVIAHYGIPDELIPDTLNLRFGADANVSRGVRERKTLVLNDIAAQTIFPQGMLEHFGIQALAGVPLFVRGAVTGVLVASRHTPNQPFDPQQVRLLEAIGAQVAVAVETAELFRSKRAEAQLSAGLARAAEELIGSLSTPTVLERLCRLTTELLNCDVSYTFLLDSEKDHYSCVASHGTNVEEIEALRVLELPTPAVAAALDALGDDDVAVFDSSPLPVVPARNGSHLCIGLRRGDSLIGLQLAGWNDKLQGRMRRLRVGANRIGQLGSLTLENARLLLELGRANRLKSDFLATVSHEFRTPLNVILGYNDLLMEDAFGGLSEAQRETLGRMRTNAKQLLELINAILDVTRLEGGKSPLDIHTIDVAALLTEIDAEVGELRLGKPQLNFATEVATDLPALQSDPAKLKLVLKNLISNAIKFTDQGEVSVAAQVRGDGIEFRIRDTGIGIAPAAQETIFEPFRQIDGAAEQRFSGVGLGLYIVRRLLDLLHGRISLESDLGAGSIFRVWVPAQPPAGSPV